MREASRRCLTLLSLHDSAEANPRPFPRQLSRIFPILSARTQDEQPTDRRRDIFIIDPIHVQLRQRLSLRSKQIHLRLDPLQLCRCTAQYNDMNTVGVSTPGSYIQVCVNNNAMHTDMTLTDCTIVPPTVYPLAISHIRHPPWNR